MLTVGTYLADRYEIVSKIGAGGMSAVYTAKAPVLGRFVALPVLHTEFSSCRCSVSYPNLPLPTNRKDNIRWITVT